MRILPSPLFGLITCLALAATGPALAQDASQPQDAAQEQDAPKAQDAPQAPQKQEGPQKSAATTRGHPYDAIITNHAAANGVPEVLVHRVIKRESRYQPNLIGHGGTIGLMQIKLGTARSLGYTGTAEGLRDPETNLTYGIRYLAGAYRTANGNHDRAVSYYAGGYYYAAKRQRKMPLVLHALDTPAR
ncbi:MAG: transglycosylase SLT domain-containing protein [Pseudomonadota bacterium]